MKYTFSPREPRPQMRLVLARHSWHLTPDRHLVWTVAGRGRFRVHRSALQEAVCAGKVLVGVDGDEPPLNIQDLPPEVLLRIAIRWFLEPTPENIRTLAQLSAVNQQFADLLASDTARREFYAALLDVPRRAQLPPAPPGGFGAWYRRFRATWLIRQGLEVQIRAAARYWFRLWETTKLLRGPLADEWVEEMDGMSENRAAQDLSMRLGLRGFVPEAPVSLADEMVEKNPRLTNDFTYLTLYGTLLVRVDEELHLSYLLNSGLRLEDIDAIAMPRNMSLLQRRWAWDPVERTFGWVPYRLRVASELGRNAWLYFPEPRDLRRGIGGGIGPGVLRRWYREARAADMLYYTDVIALGHVYLRRGFFGRIPVSPILKLVGCASARPQVLDLGGERGEVLESFTFYDNELSISLPPAIPATPEMLYLGHRRGRPPLALPPNFELPMVEIKNVVLQYVVLARPLLLSLRFVSAQHLDVRTAGPLTMATRAILQNSVAELIGESLLTLGLTFFPALAAPFRLPARLTDLPKDRPAPAGSLLWRIRLRGAGYGRIPRAILNLPRQPMFVVDLRRNAITAESFTDAVLADVRRLFRWERQVEPRRRLDLRLNPVRRGDVPALDKMADAGFVRLDG